MTYLKVYTDFGELMEPLKNEERGRLFMAMLAYAQDGTAPALEGNERFVGPMARRIIDREAEAYESKAAASRENGRKGAKARWDRREDGADGERHTEDSERHDDDGKRYARDSERYAENDERYGANGDNSQEKEKEQDKEQEKEQEQEEEKKEEKDLSLVSPQRMCVSQEKENAPEAREHTHIPTREEIESYCRERNNGIDAEYFYNYYQANGWHMGQNPIQNWRALIRTWELRDAQRGGGPSTPSAPSDETNSDLRDTIQSVLNMARQRRARQNNTLLNYQETPTPPRLESIAFDPDEL